MSDLRDFTGKNRKFTGTIGERISTGTTAERDTATFGAGTLRYNSNNNLLEYYDGSAWREVRDLNNVITTQGDILYRDGSGLARLAAGTSGQFLKTNGSGSNPAWATVPTPVTDFNNFALLEYTENNSTFRSHGTATGKSSGDRIVADFNVVIDPYDILGIIATNTFRVNTTGPYHVDIQIQNHSMGHYKMFIYDDTNGRFAARPVPAFTSGETFQSPMVSYSISQGSNSNFYDIYYLSKGTTYSVRYSADNMAGFSTSTGYVLSGYAAGGYNSRNTLARTKITKLKVL